MMAGAYPRVLQTALDDTLGAPFGDYRLDVSQAARGDGAIGLVRGHRIPGGGLPVYDSRGLGPDLHVLSRYQLANTWVRAETVFSKGTCLRRLTTTESMAAWDYADKILSG